MKKKIALLMAAVMLFGVTVGATIAWLTSTTGPVTNTFTVGDIEITLDEVDVDLYGTPDASSSRDNSNEYKLMPGHTYTKDPTVHVDPLSEKCLLFVEVVNNLGDAESPSGNGYKTIAEQMAENGWVNLSGDVWYLADENGKILEIDVPALKGTEDALDFVVFNNFKVLETAKAGTSDPGVSSDSNVYLGDYETAVDPDKVITIKAYAIQSDGLKDMDVKDIWAKF